MILKSIKYSQYDNAPNAWTLEGFELGKVNLIVGKNATGKTKTLNIIKGLSDLLSGEIKLIFTSGCYEVLFQNTDDIKYFLSYENSKIQKEELIIEGKKLLNRGAEGKGRIMAVELGQEMSFQSPENELACVTRRDSIQHPFFEDLYEWGKSTTHYSFGSSLGKDHFAIFTKKDKKGDINIKETNKVAAFLKRGIEQHGNIIKNKIIEDMKVIGYTIDDVGVSAIPGFSIDNLQGGNLEGIYVKEKDLDIVTNQIEISQGMFRTLSLLIQLNYADLESLHGCIIIDDIGEGLDFERSTSLIKLLIDKANNSNVQVIMSTNDRFVMNNVPLEYWSVIQRVGNTSKIFNYKNSKNIFDEFEYTGLANFDFLSTEFYIKGFGIK